MPRSKSATPSPETPPPYGRPRFEVDPPARLLQRLAQAFPGFTPTDKWWIEVENKVKTTHWRNHLPGEHDAFVRNYPGLTADQLVRVLQVEGMIPAPPVDIKPTMPKNKRHLLPAKVHELAIRFAEQRRVRLEDAMAMIKSMTHRELADALTVELRYDVRAKTVSRWRLQQKGRGSPRRNGTSGADEPTTDDDDDHGQSATEDHARANKLHTSRRPDRLTRLSPQTERDFKAEAADRSAAELLHRTTPLTDAEKAEWAARVESDSCQPRARRR